MRVAASIRFTPCLLLPLIIAALPGPSSALTPFVNETADGSANNVGWWTSLALDAGCLGWLG